MKTVIKDALEHGLQSLQHAENCLNLAFNNTASDEPESKEFKELTEQVETIWKRIDTLIRSMDTEFVLEEDKSTTMNLREFVEHTTNEDNPPFNVFRTEGYEVWWARTPHAENRQEVDHFTVYAGDDQVIEYVTMDRRLVDEDHLFAIASAIGVLGPEAIVGTVVLSS